MRQPFFRGLASGLDVAVGVKNNLAGNLSLLAFSLQAIAMKRRFFDGGREVVSDGALCHGVLRGFSDSSGVMRPNNDGASVGEFARILKENKLNNFIMIDCSHANSGKNYLRQTENAINAIKNPCAEVLCWKVISKRDAARAAFSVVREQTPVSAGLRRRSFCLNCTVYCKFHGAVKKSAPFFISRCGKIIYIYCIRKRKVL